MIQPPRTHGSPVPAPAPRPQPGVNTLLASTPFGFVISGAPSGGQSFAHPWKPSLARDGVRLAKGVIFAESGHGFEPVLSTGGQDVPISGDAAKRIAPPTLRLDRAIANEQLESWVCVEVTPAKDGTLADAKGALAEGVVIEVVHRNAPSLAGEKTGRQPLALIEWNSRGPARIWPITMFHLRYHRITPAPGQGAMKHLFY